ncbi:hypothetical protein [Microbulbifer discodermiae]|uniref:hypothetical protein n=1 Tax=Microbulbifer sp. 2201CG32-9 TaxID=3232309 RepID=UPI00345BF5FD
MTEAPYLIVRAPDRSDFIAVSQNLAGYSIQASAPVKPRETGQNIKSCFAAIIPTGRLLKKAPRLIQNTKSEKCDFHFSPKINDLGVVDFAGTSIFRYQASKFFEFQQPAGVYLYLYANG